MTNTYLNKTDFQIQLKSGLKANINTTATVNSAVEGELHYATDSRALFIFNGTNNVPVRAKPNVTILYSDTTLDETYDIVVVMSGCTLTLPSALTTNHEYTFDIMSSGVYLAVPSGQTIFGINPFLCYEDEKLVTYSNGSNWR